MATVVSRATGLVLCTLLAVAQANSQDGKKPAGAVENIVMFLEIGTLSEITIPEPYTTVQIPVQIVEMRDVPGRNKKVITVHPVVPQRTGTNIRIYTQHYSFNIRLLLNQSNARVTDRLDLGRHVSSQRRWQGEDNQPGQNGRQKNGTPDATRISTSDFAIQELMVERPKLLEPNKHAHAVIQNRMVLAIDHIFHHKDKIVFKATLWNKSKVPYKILDMSVTYKERTGVPMVNRRESKAIRLAPFHKEYSSRVVEPGAESHIVYVTAKLSPQDGGLFYFLLLERNGTRNFAFEIPSHITE